MSRRRRLMTTPSSTSTDPTEQSSTAYKWVTDADAFNQLLVQASQVPRIALDTEFHRERTYWPKLALLQLRILDEIF
ncbi:MAG: hypothetical protein VX584_05895, partial [Actinomycetota bacterium]|nr:hypothetical protein [Actinomycetota bacterium]